MTIHFTVFSWQPSWQSFNRQIYGIFLHCSVLVPSSVRTFCTGLWCQSLTVFCEYGPALKNSVTCVCAQRISYLCPPTRWEHGPSIKALHRILRCAMVAISCQVYTIFLASDSTSRRQVFLGRPLFLFPWGFHVRACPVMLVVGFLSV